MKSTKQRLKQGLKHKIATTNILKKKYHVNVK